MYTYKIHLHKETEGGYTVSVPVLPGCITYGEDVDEAISMAKEEYYNWSLGRCGRSNVNIIYSSNNMRI